ncbi:hypothetical protein SCHPADRAFT_930061 [Schizopora paradoxa]|uniref:DNA (cytosine-5-)-methyltransferase n=1 Tax=Schizopora paradoxa TaxID=27342 RepID=A0A0H2RP53_9AGAM|nr:hypothetical protein SCHPADRAFT_930061 [Schizopora paradoxa]
MYSDSEDDRYYSEEDDGPNVPDRLDRVGRNLPARLNISIRYTPTWGFDEGVRELLQNWRDGLLEIPGRHISIVDVSIEFNDLKPRSGTKFEFNAYDNSNPRQLLGKISFHSKVSSNGAEKSTLEIMNRFITLDKEHLSMGDSSKKFKHEFAGGHGEGMKVGINALLRAGFKVDFFTNHHKWHWNHLHGQELRVNFSKPKGKKDAARVSDGNLYVVVKGEAMSHAFFDRFLFLRIPAEDERICPVKPAEAGRLGSILLDKKYSHKLYVAGIFVQEHQGGNGLHYGYDIPKFKLTRDREATNSYKLGEAICNLWNNLLPTSAPARSRFLELFEVSPSCLDISNAEYTITQDTAKVLLRDLKDAHPGIWFCSTVDKDLETTEFIIRNSLKMQPKRLPMPLWDIFHDRFHLVKTAKQERVDRFKAAPPTRRISAPSEFASHTIHLLRIFLALDNDTRSVQVSFVSADGDSDLEYVFENSRCLVNDSHLRATALDHPACMHFHSLTDHEGNEEVSVPEHYTCSCSAIKLANLIYEEALAKRPPDNRHSLNFFRQNLVQWIPVNISSETIWSDATDEIQSVKISWSAALSTSDVHFVVIIEEMPSEILNIQEKKELQLGNALETRQVNINATDDLKSRPDFGEGTTGGSLEVDCPSETSSIARTIDYHSVSINGVKRSTEANSVREVAKIRSSEPSAYFVDFRSGHKYRVQIQADKELPLLGDVLKAPPSRPFFVYGPLRPPQELAVRWENVDQLSVTWKPSEGATQYEVVFLGNEAGETDDPSEAIRVVDAILGWTGLPNIDRPKRVRVRSLGVHGLVSERFTEATIPKRLSPPEGITVSWESSNTLIVGWEPATWAEKYEVCFHQDETKYTLEVSGVSWKGSPRTPSPIAVSIRSIASREVRSEYSPEIAVPGPPVKANLRVYGASNGIGRAAPARALVVERYQEPLPLEVRAPSVHSSSDGDVDDILNRLEPRANGYAFPRQPTIRSTPEVDPIDKEAEALADDDGDNFGRMIPLPLPPLYDPPSDSSDDETPDDEDSDLDISYMRNVRDDDFNADVNISIEILEETRPFSGGHERRSTYDRMDYEVLNECIFSGTRLAVEDLFEFKRQRSDDPRVPIKQSTFLGQVLEIRKLKPSGQIVLLIRQWAYFNLWFNEPKSHEIWKENVEDAVVLIFDRAFEMGTLEDAQVIDESNISWCSRARHQNVVFKNAFDSSEAQTESFVCRFAATLSSAFTVVSLPAHLSGEEFRGSSEPDNSPPSDSWSVADLFCGAGGLSLGFKQAGFDIKYGVDRDIDVLNTFSHNYSTATNYAQPVEDFIQDHKAGNCLPSFKPTVVLASPSWQDLKPGDNSDLIANAAEDVVKEFKPPFLVYALAPRSKDKTVMTYFNRIILQLLQEGYSFSYKHMDCQQYGAANGRIQLVLLAARGDHKLPQWPEPSVAEKANYTTVQQVISDLNFENKRAGKDGATSDRLGGTFCAVATNSPELSKAAKKLRDKHARVEGAADASGGGYWVWNHVTGRRKRARWTAVDPDGPLPVVRSTPSAEWACKHWERGDILTVRELARIMSFPDGFRFYGSLESQYRQVANATPPCLAKALAESIMRQLQERQMQIKSENLAIKLEMECDIKPKLEVKEEEDTLSDMDASPLPPSSRLDRKRKFEEDDVPADVAPSSAGASHERLVKPRLGKN